MADSQVTWLISYLVFIRVLSSFYSLFLSCFRQAPFFFFFTLSHVEFRKRSFGGGGSLQLLGRWGLKRESQKNEGVY